MKLKKTYDYSLTKLLDRNELHRSRIEKFHQAGVVSEKQRRAALSRIEWMDNFIDSVQEDLDTERSRRFLR